jgi:hypothetical protein
VLEGIHLKFTEELFVSCSAVLNKEQRRRQLERPQSGSPFNLHYTEQRRKFKHTRGHTHTSISFAALAFMTQDSRRSYFDRWGQMSLRTGTPKCSKITIHNFPWCANTIEERMKFLTRPFALLTEAKWQQQFKQILYIKVKDKVLPVLTTKLNRGARLWLHSFLSLQLAGCERYIQWLYSLVATSIEEMFKHQNVPL